MHTKALKNYRTAQKLRTSEEQEQVVLASWLDARGLLWCHVPNGGQRSKATGSRLKRMGVKAGVPDILIFGRLNIAIELKRADGALSDVSEAQEWWLEQLEARGWVTMVGYGATDAIAKLSRYYP